MYGFPKTYSGSADIEEGIDLILDAAVMQLHPSENRAECRGVTLALEALIHHDEIPAQHVLARAFYRAGKFDEDALRFAVDHALMAFWNQLAACYPEIKSGDMDPLTDARIRSTMTDAARHWLQGNA